MIDTKYWCEIARWESKTQEVFNGDPGDRSSTTIYAPGDSHALNNHMPRGRRHSENRAQTSASSARCSFTPRGFTPLARRLHSFRNVAMNLGQWSDEVGVTACEERGVRRERRCGTRVAPIIPCATWQGRQPPRAPTPARLSGEQAAHGILRPEGDPLCLMKLLITGSKMSNIGPWLEVANLPCMMHEPVNP